jgi:hypothetical protein
VQLHWAQWTSSERSETPRTPKPPGDGGFMRRATDAWSRLPLGLANRLGPLISPKLPW